MSIFISLLSLAVGLVLVAKGGDWLVDSAVKIAKVLRIPTMVVGATIVSIGTTLPELVTSIMSMVMAKGSQFASDMNAIAIGNSVGSMLCNIGIILAMVVIVRPVKTDGEYSAKSLFFLVVTLLLMIFMATSYGLEIYEAVILLVIFALYLALNLAQSVRSRKISQVDFDKELVKPTMDVYTAVRFILGAIAISIGAYLLVTSTTKLCHAIGIPTQIVAVTVVAIGTSLPELVTSIVSLKKGQSHLGIGNVLGANIINGCLLLGTVTCVGKGIILDPFTKSLAMYILLMMVAVITLPTLVTKKINRWQGIACLALYITFVGLNIAYIAS